MRRPSPEGEVRWKGVARDRFRGVLLLKSIPFFMAGVKHEGRDHRR